MKQYVFILLIVLTIFPAFRCPEGNAEKTLSAETSVERLRHLNARVADVVSTPGECAAIDQLRKEAKMQNSSLYEAMSYYYYTHYYRSNLKIEEAAYWLQRLDSVARPNRFHTLLYEGHGLLVELYCICGNFDLAMDKAKRMSEEVASLNCPLSHLIVDNSLATVYMSTRQNEEAQKILQYVLSVPAEESLPLIRKTSLALMASAELRLSRLDVAEGYLHELHELLARNEENAFSTSRVYNTNLNIRYHVYSVQCNLLRGDSLQARKHLEEIAKVSGPTSYIYSQALYHRTCADYYLSAGQSELALEEWDKEMALLDSCSGYYLAALRQKASVLKQRGEYKEAFEAYQRFMLLQNSEEQECYILQINQFKSAHEADRSRIANAQLTKKSNSLYALVIALLLFSVILVILIQVNRRLKKKLLLARQRSERSGYLKSAFLANMNHEIRTPLNAIAGFSQLLVDEDDPQICEQYTNIIRGNNELLVNLLNDILDLSGIESDTITFSYAKVHVQSVINDLYEAAKLQIPASVSLIKGATPDLHLYTDRNRLIQVLSNLLSNAIKHTAEGQITIGYELWGSDNVRFHVTDTGEGISDESQRKIFARFVQAAETSSKGVGLGLALCKGFVEHLGGEIGVESVAGKGSTFWFTLPCRMPDNESL